MIDLNKDRIFCIQDLFDENPNSLSLGKEWKNQIIYYYDPQVTFREIPDEISLTIPSLCYEHCSEDCNSKFCWFENWKEDKEVLDNEVLNKLVEENPFISCITIMTSLNFNYLENLFINFKQTHPKIKIALYIGKDLKNLLHADCFRKFNFGLIDYIKVGEFNKKFGPLNNLNTNQVLYKVNHLENKDIFENINYKFFLTVM